MSFTPAKILQHNCMCTIWSCVPGSCMGVQADMWSLKPNWLSRGMQLITQLHTTFHGWWCNAQYCILMPAWLHIIMNRILPNGWKLSQVGPYFNLVPSTSITLHPHHPLRGWSSRAQQHTWSVFSPAYEQVHYLKHTVGGAYGLVTYQQHIANAIEWSIILELYLSFLVG